MKALGSRASCSMRVLSPRMLPRLMLLLGSTASTATFFPWRQSQVPKASMSELLPAPGTPVMPMRTEPPVCGSRFASTACASSMRAEASLSISVMACASSDRSPRRTPPAYSSGESRRRRGWRVALTGVGVAAAAGTMRTANSGPAFSGRQSGCEWTGFVMRGNRKMKPAPSLAT